MSHQKHIEHFNSVDQVIANLITDHGEIKRTYKTDHFDALVRAIISQQVSTKAADAVYGRLRARYNDIIDPGILAKASQEELREVGVSRQKHSYLNDLGSKFMSEPETFEKLESLDDADVITSLTSIKGIGVWTAQMFLMFSLDRPDVFPIDDLGIRQAMSNHYEIDREDRKRMKAISEKWAPYRTVACVHLWRSLH